MSTNYTRQAIIDYLKEHVREYEGLPYWSLAMGLEGVLEGVGWSCAEEVVVLGEKLNQMTEFAGKQALELSKANQCHTELLQIHKIIMCPGDVKPGDYDSAPYTVKAVANYITAMNLIMEDTEKRLEKEREMLLKTHDRLTELTARRGGPRWIESRDMIGKELEFFAKEIRSVLKDLGF
jgi:hypothetical protein